MFLVAAVMLPLGNLRAQNPESKPDDSQYERLGDSPLDQDIDLDLTVPVRQAAPPSKLPEIAAPEPSQQIADFLASATRAMQAGRIDQPPDDCAWFYYRAVLDIDPGNPEALQGLLEVQQVMLASA